MSLYEYLPLLTDEIVAAYDSEASPDDKLRYNAHFEVEKVLGVPANTRHLLGVSLFFKPRTRHESNSEIILTEDTLRQPELYGMNPAFNPWDHYIQPVLDYSGLVKELAPEVSIRIYLANDLAFLAERLALHCEVWIMKSSSIASAPGMIWRHLGLEDHPGLYTQIDADLFPSALDKIAITTAMDRMGLGSWRAPSILDFREGRRFSYRPMAGSMWGASARLEVRKLLSAFLWASERDLLSCRAKLPFNDRSFPSHGAAWPDYGIDEFFLMTAIFPRLAEHGILTLLTGKTRSCYLPLDIEFCNWSCKESTITYRMVPLMLTPGEGVILPHEKGKTASGGGVAERVA